jgi:hypothetical protein
MFPRTEDGTYLGQRSDKNRRLVFAFVAALLAVSFILFLNVDTAWAKAGNQAANNNSGGEKSGGKKSGGKKSGSADRPASQGDARSTGSQAPTDAEKAGKNAETPARSLTTGAEEPTGAKPVADKDEPLAPKPASESVSEPAPEASADLPPLAGQTSSQPTPDSQPTEPAPEPVIEAEPVPDPITEPEPAQPGVEPTPSQPLPTSEIPAPVVTDPAPVPTAPVVTDPAPVPTAPVVTDPAPVLTAPVDPDPAPVPTTPVDPAPVPTTPVVTDPAPVPTAPVVTDPTPILTDLVVSDPLPTPVLSESALAPVFGYAPEYMTSGPAVEPATTSEGVVAVLSQSVDQLLNPASERNLAERTVVLVDELRQLADDMLLGGSEMAGAADAPSAALKGLPAELLGLVDGLLNLESGQDLTQRVAGLVGNLMGLLDGLVGEGGTPSPVPAPSYPHAPVAPVPAPSYPTSISSNGSLTFGEGSASVLLLAVLAPSLVIFLRAGKHSWTSRVTIGPCSALQPTIERPG